MKNFLFFFVQFNDFLYRKFDIYHPLLGKIIIGFLYGSILGVLFAYWGLYIIRLLIYGGSALLILYWLDVVAFNKAVFSSLVGIDSVPQLLNFLQNLLDVYPVELISCAFFFIFLFIFIRKYH